jgi:hypothetical protein
MPRCQHRVKSSKMIESFYRNNVSHTHNLAYLAGLIDGEGYVKVEKWGTIRIIIGMCAKRTIYWIRDKFGGSVHIQKTKKGRPFYVWRLNQGKDLTFLLVTILPFLKNKKQKVKTALKRLIDIYAKDGFKLCRLVKIV